MLNATKLTIKQENGFGIIFGVANYTDVPHKHNETSKLNTSENSLQTAMNIDKALRELNIQMHGEYIQSPQYYAEKIAKYRESSKYIPDINDNQFKKPFSELSIQEKNSVINEKVAELKRKQRMAEEWEKTSKEYLKMISETM